VAGVSDRYVHKLFAARRMTFGAYVTERRLNHICADLISTRHSVLGIAYRWGFNDISAFNKAFKKRYGCTPSRYRGLK
jgi:AraC family transcriptional activator of tynA and feaB